MCSGLCSPLLHCYPLHTVVIGGHPRDEDRKGRCASLCTMRTAHLLPNALVCVCVPGADALDSHEVCATRAEVREECKERETCAACATTMDGIEENAVCPYKKKCSEFLKSLGINDAYFLAEHDRCYCSTCASRIPGVLERDLSRWPHGCPYEVPKG